MKAGATVPHSEHVRVLDRLSEAQGRYMRAEAALLALEKSGVLNPMNDFPDQAAAKAQAHDAIRMAV